MTISKLYNMNRYIGYKNGEHLRHLAHLNKNPIPYIYAEEPFLQVHQALKKARKSTLSKNKGSPHSTGGSGQKFKGSKFSSGGSKFSSGGSCQREKDALKQEMHNY